MEIIHTRNSKELAKSLAKELSLSVFSANMRRFNNGEMLVSIPKRFCEVIVIASTVTNEDWMELFLLLDALRDAKHLILCMPYMGYSRQDIQNKNESFGAGLFFQFLETMNISSCIVVDNHAEPFIRLPVVNISASKIFESDIRSKYITNQITVVSPDIGGASRANVISEILRCGFAICNKSKDVFGKLKKVDVIGNIANKMCVLVDDIVDSGLTLCSASESLSNAGCKGIIAYVTHGVLSTGAVEMLEKSSIAEITLTDSIPLPPNLSEKFKKVSITSLIGEAIQCML